MYTSRLQSARRALPSRPPDRMVQRWSNTPRQRSPPLPTTQPTQTPRLPSPPRQPRPLAHLPIRRHRNPLTAGVRGYQKLRAGGHYILRRREYSTWWIPGSGVPFARRVAGVTGHPPRSQDRPWANGVDDQRRCQTARIDSVRIDQWLQVVRITKTRSTVWRPSTRRLRFDGSIRGSAGSPYALTDENRSSSVSSAIHRAGGFRRSGVVSRRV